MTAALHPDWDATDSLLDSPASDFEQAIADDTYPRWGRAEPVSQELPEAERFKIADVEAVTRYHVTYHDEVPWAPGRSTGTELNLLAVGRLRDGRWFSVEAWNDYTGWGCQDGSDIRVGATEEQVVRFGLSAEARSALGYAEVRP